MQTTRYTATDSLFATGSVGGVVCGMAQSIWWWRGNWWRSNPLAVPFASAWGRES